MQTYLVGGAVRDELLGRPVGERDWVVVGATPDALLARGFRQVGKDFPVFLHPQSGEEYALARTERKTGPGYHGFVTHFSPEVTLEEDLARRDLTINAMARALDGTLVDPYGGRADLELRVLRHVSPAFVEDPLRVLRVARFAARYAPVGFSIAPATLALMSRIAASGELRALAAERVWQETQRALGERAPWVYFGTLRACGALAELFPELDALYGVPQPARWHPEIDTGVHTMMVLEVAAGLSDELDVRFAALCHDLGKATTPPEQWPGHAGHEQAGVTLIERLAARLRVPNELRELAVLASQQHGKVHRAFELRAATILELLEQCDAFRRPERFARLMLACEADARGRGEALRAQAYPQAHYLLRAAEAARAVKLEPAEFATLEGAAIGERLRRLRLAAVRAAAPAST